VSNPVVELDGDEMTVCTAAATSWRREGEGNGRDGDSVL